MSVVHPCLAACMFYVSVNFDSNYGYTYLFWSIFTSVCCCQFTTATSLASFKKQLKTFLFTKSFPEF